MNGNIMGFRPQSQYQSSPHLIGALEHIEGTRIKELVTKDESPCCLNKFSQLALKNCLESSKEHLYA